MRERERETETGHLREKWAPAEKKTEKCSEGEGGGADEERDLKRGGKKEVR